MRKIRFLLRLLKAFVKRHFRLVLAGFLAGTLAFFLVPKILPFLPKKTPTFKIGILGRFQSDEIPVSIQREISQGLTVLSEDGTAISDIATSWQQDKEAKTYTFHLKKDVRWHDKSILKASDVNYNFRDVQVEVKDDQTLIFKLGESFSPFPTVVSRPIFKKGLIGTGNYKVKKVTQTGKYLNSIFLQSLKGHEPNLLFRFYPTEEALRIGFKLGEIDTLEDLLELGELKNWPGTTATSTLHFNRFVTLFFNTSDDFLGDKGIRQALAYAISKKEGEERALGPISPLSWAYNSDVKPYEKDLDHARSLLKNALEGKENKEIHLTLSSVPSLLDEAEKIKKEWEELGIKVEVRSFSPGEDFQILLAIQEVPLDPDQYTLWHSTQEGNLTKFKSPRVDKLLEDGRRVSDQEERKQIYYDFQRFLVEEVPAVFLYYPTTWTLKRN